MSDLVLMFTKEAHNIEKAAVKGLELIDQYCSKYDFDFSSNTATSTTDAAVPTCEGQQSRQQQQEQSNSNKKSSTTTSSSSRSSTVAGSSSNHVIEGQPDDTSALLRQYYPDPIYAELDKVRDELTDAWSDLRQAMNNAGSGSGSTSSGRSNQQENIKFDDKNEPTTARRKSNDTTSRGSADQQQQTNPWEEDFRTAYMEMITEAFGDVLEDMYNNQNNTNNSTNNNKNKNQKFNPSVEGTTITATATATTNNNNNEATTVVPQQQMEMDVELWAECFQSGMELMTVEDKEFFLRHWNPSKDDMKDDTDEDEQLQLTPHEIRRRQLGFAKELEGNVAFPITTTTNTKS